MNKIHTPYQKFGWLQKLIGYTQTSNVWMYIIIVFVFSACQPPQDKPATLFTEVPADQSRVHFINQLPYNHHMNNMVYDYYYNGGGVAIGDINNDDLPDLYFSANLLPDKLYLNKGNLEFEDITKQSGIGHGKSWTTGVTMVDINADGWLDIYVCKSGRLSESKRTNHLYVNQQNGQFVEQAAAFGLNSSHYSTQATFFDYDLDGDLDCFLLNHPIEKTKVKSFKKTRAEKHKYGGDQLFENQNGVFVDVSAEAGIIANPLSFGLGIAVGDLNYDGWPDLMVTNDYSEPDYLYYNQKNGTFKDVVKEKTNQISNFSMGTDIADFNNDGWLDIVTAEMSPEDNYSIKTSMSGMNPKQFQRLVENGMHHQYMYNTLQVNNGNGYFSEVGQMAKIANTGWSWAALFADFDLDGNKDLFFTNGYRRDNSNNDFKRWYESKLEEFEGLQVRDTVAFMTEVVDKIPEVRLSNYMFKNIGNYQFENQTEPWGVEQVSYSTGAAYGDLDQDGDLDLVINNVDERAQIFENQANSWTRNNYLKVSLKGLEHNPAGVGARVTVYNNGGLQVQENYATRGYQSAMCSELVFGIGPAEQIDSIRVEWADGSQSKQLDIQANQSIRVEWLGTDSRDHTNLIQLASIRKPITTPSQPSFEDITQQAGINHLHRENEFNDFEKESLLPHKMSQFGPAVAVGDVNGDGLEDFFVGGAKGQPGELYYQNSSGQFSASGAAFWQQEKKYEDLDALFFDFDNDGDLDLYVVSGGNEFEPQSELLQDRLYINNGKGSFARSELLPEIRTSGSCVKPIDFDNDGDQDLFVGGRLVPGRYPLPARSYILKNTGGKFEDVTKRTCPALLEAGLVTDALWTDFNGDKKYDLIVVGEWMSIRFFESNGMEWLDVTGQTGISDQVGWWFSINQSDFDQDGDLDYVVGNLGLNYKYKASLDEPFTIYTKDFDESGNLDIVLGYYNNGIEFPLRGRECTSNQMPFIKEKFPTYHDFAVADIGEVYGAESLDNSWHYAATQFASIYVENLGNGRFEISRLPIEAQFSSVNEVLIEDIDRDGLQDIIVAGNLYQSEVETPRNDASYGLVLNGDGTGKFSTMPFVQSRLFIPGDTKNLNWIKMANGKKAILAGKNDDYVQLIEWRP